MHIEISDQPLDAWQLVQDYEYKHSELSGKHGASVVFLGRMRDFNESASITEMELEHYPGMTEKFLETIADNAMQQWDILDVLIIHRVGKINPSDTIVIVAVWAAHRAHGYEANQFIMEALKSKAPFWKKETLSDGQTRWVDKNTPGKTVS